MSSSKQQIARKGMGLGSILTIIFVLAKILQIGVCATWSWWLVFSPLWVPFALIIGFTLFCLVMAGIASMIK